MSQVIRLWGENSDSSELLRDFTSVSEAREAIPTDAKDWVIFALPGDKRGEDLRVLDCIDGDV